MSYAGLSRNVQSNTTAPNSHGVAGADGLPTGDGRQVTLAHWTGGDSGLTHPAITHEYPTFSDGRAAFYKQLKREIKKIWPDAKFIVEPYNIMYYWLSNIVDRPDRDTLCRDLLVCDEEWGLDFVHSPAFTDHPTLVQRDHSCLTVPNQRDTESHGRLLAGHAGKYGAWMAWYFRFNENSVTLDKVAPQEKLVRVVPNWDNIAGVPLNRRKLDMRDTTYVSPNSRLDGKVMQSRHPETGKIFAIFLSDSGKVKLDSREKLVAAHRTDSRLLIESVDGMAELTVAKGSITLRNKAHLGQCYILTTTRSIAVK